MNDEAKGRRSATEGIISFSRVMNIVAMVALVAMMLLTVVDVLMRTLFKLPVLDSPQLTQYLMVCVVFFGLAWCAARERHIKVDLIVSRFSPRTQALFDSVTMFLGLAVTVVMTWRSLLETFVAYRYNAATTVLEIPAYPFHIILVLGLAVLCTVMLTQLIRNIREAAKR